MENKRRLILISVKLSENTVRKVDLLVTRGIFIDRSEAIRAALEQYFQGTARRWLEMYYKRRG